MADRIVRTRADGEQARIVLDALGREYAQLYGELRAGKPGPSEIERYPASAFAPPLGDFLLLVRNGVVVAGGAYMSHDDETVEIKRVWTDSRLRRQGLARTIMAALEESAVAAGYCRAYLTTGFRQPEASTLYVSLGYRPLFDTSVDPRLIRSLPFEKPIGPRAESAGASSTPRKPTSVSLEAATALTDSIKAGQERVILARIEAHLSRASGKLSTPA